jgi:hypothetical protein
MPLSVDRKEAADADAVYEQIRQAMGSGIPKVIELTCEKQPEKKIAILTDQISGVVVSQKSGAAATGRVPGFLNVAGA